MRTHFLERLLVGLLLVAVTALLLFLSHEPHWKPIFALIFAGALSLTLWEFYQIAFSKGLEPLEKSGIVTAFVFTLTLFLTTQLPSIHSLPWLVLALSLLFSFCLYLNRGSSPLVNLSVTYFGLLYLVIPLSTLLLINYSFGDGRWWVFYALAVTKSTDTAAYIAGITLGKRALAPTISPKKTVEGGVAGLVGAVAVSLLFYYLLPLFGVDAMKLSFGQSIYLGLIISVLAQLGDLVESLLKRDAKIKDSNRLPGLGGLLDMSDSLIFTLPFLYFYLQL